MALIDTLREVTANESDDYFETDTLVYYINAAQRFVVSSTTRQEKDGQTSFRVLDKLRKSDSNVLSGFSAVSDWFEGTQNAPSDFLDWLYLDYEDVPLKELTVPKWYLLRQGNVEPTQDEGYFSVIEESSNISFKLFIHEDPDGASDSLTVQYIALPTEITSGSTSFDEIPDQLINAVIYKAASLMSLQEGREDLAEFENKYQQELQIALF